LKRIRAVFTFAFSEKGQCQATWLFAECCYLLRQFFGSAFKSIFVFAAFWFAFIFILQLELTFWSLF